MSTCLQIGILHLIISIPSAVYAQTVIYETNFTDSTGWIGQLTGEKSEIAFNSFDGGCDTIAKSDGDCLYLKNPTFVSRMIPTAGYKSIHITIAVAENVDDGDYCYLQYRTSLTNWTRVNLATKDILSIQNGSIAIPSTSEYENRATFQIGLGNNGTGEGRGDDKCYFSHLRVFGVFDDSLHFTYAPTTDPTAVTLAPSTTPTISPECDPNAFYCSGFDDDSWRILTNGNQVTYIANTDDNCISWAWGNCVSLEGGTAIYQVISTVGYHSIQIRLDGNEKVDVGDYCYIQYRIPSNEWTTVNLLTMGDGVKGNNIVYIPDDLGSDDTTFEVQIGNNGTDATDKCYFDNFEMFGTLFDPTPQPTLYPTLGKTDLMIIFKDDFVSISDWTQEIVTNKIEIHDGRSCDDIGNDSSCLLLEGATLVSRTIPTSGFYDIHIRIDTRETGLDVDQYCYLQYRTASTSWSRHIIIATGGDDNVLNAIFAMPNNEEYDDNPTFQVRLGNLAGGNKDKCYFDNLEILARNTPNPTGSPTNDPTLEPTLPTIARSAAPTLEPTFNPTVNPTSPTLEPTTDPTNTQMISTSIDSRTNTISDSTTSSLQTESDDDTKSSDDDQNDQSNQELLDNQSTLTVIIAIGGGVVLLVGVACGIFIGVKCALKRQSKSKSDEEEIVITIQHDKHKRLESQPGSVIFNASSISSVIGSNPEIELQGEHNDGGNMHIHPDNSESEEGDTEAIYGKGKETENDVVTANANEVKVEPLPSDRVEGDDGDSEEESSSLTIKEQVTTRGPC